MKKRLFLFLIIGTLFSVFVSPKNALAANTFRCQYNPNNHMCTPDALGASCYSGYSIDPNKCLVLDQSSCSSTQTCVAGPQPAYDPAYYPQNQQQNTVGNIATISNLNTIFGNVIRLALGLAGITLFVLLIVGGFKFITSGGDPKAVEGARKTLTSAIAGLIIILISYLILVLITKLTGVDVTNFNITLPQ